MPRPRSVSDTKVSERSRQPDASAIRAAAWSPRRLKARPPRRRTAGEPPRRSPATALTASSEAAAGGSGCRGSAGSASPHWQSWGAISVATWPGALRAVAIAAAPSRGSSSEELLVRTQFDIGRARDSMSEVSGASAATCHVAWSPMRLTMGVRARRALWTLARLFAKPGPRWVSVRAGLPEIRA